MRRKMRKLCLLVIAALLLVFAGSAIQSEAGVDVSIGIGLPPLAFAAPPSVIVLPDTFGVYAVPDIDAELYFWNGWWWRFWDGRWYRSRYYDRGYLQYYRIPAFYYDVDPGWRRYYYDRHWYGHRWDYEPIPHSRLHANWRNWNTNRYWERQRTWGVQGYQPRPQSQRREIRQQRERQYQQRPEVQKHRRDVQRPQRQEQRREVQQQKQHQGKPEKGEGKRRK